MNKQNKIMYNSSNKENYSNLDKKNSLHSKKSFDLGVLGCINFNFFI